MCENLEKKELNDFEIQEYIESYKCREDKTKKQFLQKISYVREGSKVVFHEYYVNELLGGVADRVKNQADLFNSVG